MFNNILALKRFAPDIEINANVFKVYFEFLLGSIKEIWGHWAYFGVTGLFTFNLLSSLFVCLCEYTINNENHS
jgi:hypothetical protein